MIISAMMSFLQKYVIRPILQKVSSLYHESVMLACSWFRTTSFFREKQKKQAMQVWLKKHGRKFRRPGPTSFLHLLGGTLICSTVPWRLIGAELRNQINENYLAQNDLQHAC